MEKANLVKKLCPVLYLKIMMLYEDKIQKTLEVIQGDPVLMFIASISFVVLLFIMLVVVVSAMRVKVYKNRFKNLLLTNKEQEEHISKIEKELQTYKIKDTQNKQALAQFDDTKSTLKTANESYLSLQSTHDANEKELAQNKAQLKQVEEKFQALEKEHKDLIERFDVIFEENTKYRTSNARLLTKLETEERYAQAMKQQQESKKS